MVTSFPASFYITLPYSLVFIDMFQFFCQHGVAKFPRNRSAPLSPINLIWVFLPTWQYLGNRHNRVSIPRDMSFRYAKKISKDSKNIIAIVGCPLKFSTGCINEIRKGFGSNSCNRQNKVQIRSDKLTKTETGKTHCSTALQFWCPLSFCLSILKIVGEKVTQRSLLYLTI